MATDERIEALAQKVWELSGKQFPVNPVKAAEYYNIPVYEASLNDGASGGITRIDGNVKIYMSNDDPKNRARFTVAHELGHYLLHFNDEGTEDYAVVDYHRDSLSSEGIDRFEIEANQFAAALLMNREMILWYWEEYKSIPVIAKEFGVSAEAARYRLKNLGVKV